VNGFGDENGDGWLMGIASWVRLVACEHGFFMIPFVIPP